MTLLKLERPSVKHSKTYFERLVDKGRSLAARGLGNMRSGKNATPLSRLQEKCAELLGARGQASGIKMAGEVHGLYHECSDTDRRAFFDFLLTEFGRDKDELIKTCAAYSENPDHKNLKALAQIMEPRRQELFKRMNMAPGGTMALIEMRTDLLRYLKANPELKPVDLDFLQLFKTWFNRGFLTMEPITWKSPAVILERLIAYEAVHEITSWDDLKRRLDPPDRLCFGFFHPSLADTPLIFVEVALCEDIPGSIQDILSPRRDILPSEKAKVATFYSINNCLTGLKGIYFGNFLIKQVVANLQVAHPGLKKFVTLSPIPGFRNWLLENDRAGQLNISSADLEQILTSRRRDDVADLDLPMRQAALAYLLDRQENSHRLQDSVARFHLGNGARIENIQWQADTSARGRDIAYGLMVNYLYELDQIEHNHEAFAVRHEVALSAEMRNLKRRSLKAT